MTSSGPAEPVDRVAFIVDRYMEEIYTARDPAAGIERLSAAVIELGFAAACCCLWPRTCLTVEAPPPPCLLLYGPQHDATYRSWFSEYRQGAMQVADPCFAICRSSTAPFVWNRDDSAQIVRGHSASAAERRGVDLLYERTGITSGIAIPLQLPGSWFGYCSFASTSPPDWILEHRELLEDPLLAMSYRFYDAVADRLGLLIAQQNGLSQQELDCLGLLAVGKTVEEIAQICNLPYSTVRSRLRKAEHKLSARNRSQAIATAAALGVLERID
jgi:DNA-binding CsgD family transcriptional regulator